MSDFHNMTDHDLFCTVFGSDGQVKACGRDACMELMRRLKNATGYSYGDTHTGRLELPDAYHAARQLYL